MNWDYERILPADFNRLNDEDVGTSILHRFSGIVDANGDQVAIDGPDESLTYAELNEASDSLAAVIVDQLGSAPEPIALLYSAGAEYCRAQFGVLKSGKFFASLDFELESQRLMPLLKDLGVRLILCQTKLEDKARAMAKSLPDCDVINSERVNRVSSQEFPGASVSADSIAYVIYTSGSTGPPEGVLISHRSLLHFVMNHTNTTHLRRADRGLQICPLSSAGSAGEIFPILLNGGTLFPFALKHFGAHRLIRLILDERITVCTFVPVVFRLLLNSLPNGLIFPDVRLVRLSGDRILRKDCLNFTKHFSPHCLLRISLGASEAMLYTHYYVNHEHISETEIVPAGYAMQDMDVFVVDENLRRLGPNETGEIVVKSKYLSSGYWRNDALTAERFRESDEADGTRIYLTRDVGYLEPDGCLVHQGRKDSRVKIYGKMVTISEIEQFLLGVSHISEAVVVAVAYGVTERYLAAYCVSDPAKPRDPASIRKALVAKFPVEIVPRKIIFLDSLPLTERNKIDRRHLAQKAHEIEGDQSRMQAN